MHRCGAGDELPLLRDEMLKTGNERFLEESVESEPVGEIKFRRPSRIFD